MDQLFHAVAIDGPSGAGKSTLARRVAKELHFLYVDTGAIYRSIGWYALQQGAALDRAESVAALLPDLNVEVRYGEDGLQHMVVNDRDVTEEIRSPEVSAAASQVAAVPEVRAYLLDMQRDLARTHDVIMDGRDIGTVVLPEADCKIFLTASDEARAARRCRELAQRGTPVAYEDVLSDMRRRDEKDRTRAAAPLRQAEDAVVLDTSELDFEDSAQALLRLIRESIGHEA
ncbi:MAG: (d)CMP kinase [Clostridiales bacterium]|nr:(d)CMP kinase [Clostridiales bacterium]MDY4035884.1 (d)CMP kinase [Candidatus Pseudoscilispira sp.]